MKDEELIDELILGKLETDNVRFFIDDLYSPNQFPGVLVERLASQCDGNPFFLVEMLKQMEIEGGIAKDDGKYVLVSENYFIPATVEDVVHRRLENLEPDTMAMAEYSSCIGRVFEYGVALSIQSLKNAPSALEKLHDTGIIIKNNGSIEFSHAIFQDVIYRSIRNRWKSAYHKNLGEYYEELYENRLDDVIYDLARHFSRSNEHQKTFDYCLRGAEKAENAFAPEQAAVFYGDALTALPRLRMKVGAAKEVEICERLGDVQRLYGDYDNTIANYQRAAEVAERKEIRARNLRKASEVYQSMGDFDKSLKIQRMAKDIIEGERTSEYGRIIGLEGNAYSRTGNYDKALTIFLEVSRLFEELGSEEKDTGNVLRNIGNIHLSRGEYDDALEYYDKALTLLKETGEQYGMVGVLNNIGIVYQDTGELDKAIDYYGQSLEIKEKIGDKPGTAATLNNIGGVYFDRGELDQTLEYYEKSLAIAEKIGDKQVIASSQGNIGNVHYYMGELDKALRYYEKSLVLRVKMGDKRGLSTVLNNVGNVYLNRGEMDRATECFEKSLDIAENIGNRVGVIHVHCGLGEIALELGDTRGALENAEKALDISMEIGAKVEEGMSHRLYGMVYREKGEFEKAVGEFEKSHTILEDVGRKDEPARLFFEYGLLWKKRNEPDQAKEYLEKALEMFKSMGTRLWEEKCREALGKFE